MNVHEETKGLNVHAIVSSGVRGSYVCSEPIYVR